MSPCAPGESSANTYESGEAAIASLTCVSDVCLSAGGVLQKVEGQLVRHGRHLLLDLLLQVRCGGLATSTMLSAKVAEYMRMARVRPLWAAPSLTVTLMRSSAA
jgi:hypothetical protein